MIETTLDTQAILLLTAPLITGRGEDANGLLTPGEFKRLLVCLHENGWQPADLLAPEAGEMLERCASVADPARLANLLGRGILLCQALERWQARSFWVVSREDEQYPQRLRERLGQDAPALLYGCGEIEILDRGGLAVVGSRNVDESLVEYTMEIGCLAARARQTVVSGGARGIDRAAMRGALEADGTVIGVLADSLERMALQREHRDLILDGRLLLVSPFDPNAGFNVGNAMQRNKLIYVLADAALVVSAELEKGGTWAGAREHLTKLRLVPVYVRSTGEPSEALEALRHLGALPWPHPQDADELLAALVPPPPLLPVDSEPAQMELIFEGLEVREPLQSDTQQSTTSKSRRHSKANPPSRSSSRRPRAPRAG